jgi:hypothetical protein
VGYILLDPELDSKVMRIKQKSCWIRSVTAKP